MPSTKRRLISSMKEIQINQLEERLRVTTVAQFCNY